MKVELIAVGKIKPPFAEAEAHYLKLLKPLMPVEVTETRDDDALGRQVKSALATGGNRPDPAHPLADGAG